MTNITIPRALLEEALEYVEGVPDDRLNVEHIDRDALVQALTATLSQAETAEPQPVVAWAIPSTGQFSWQQQDERYWTRMVPAVAQQPQEPGGIVITRTTNGAIMQIRAVERYRGIGEGGAQQPQEQGEVVVTRNEAGAIVAVTRQDSEGRILHVIAETQQEPRKPLTKDKLDDAISKALTSVPPHKAGDPLSLLNIYRAIGRETEAAHGIGEAGNV